MKTAIGVWVVLGALAATAVRADDGRVELPLEAYQALMRPSGTSGRAAPDYAFSGGTASVEFDEERGIATVSVSVTVRTYESGWHFVPILPASVQLLGATIGAGDVQFVPSPVGLALPVDGAQTASLDLEYEVPIVRSTSGRSVAIALPAAAFSLSASIPGAGGDVAVIPASSVSVQQNSAGADITASIPAGTGAHLSWRMASGDAAVVSRAIYRGQLTGEVFMFTATFDLDSPGAGSGAIALLPASVALAQLQVDGREEPILVQDEAWYAIAPRQRGRHSVRAAFTVPVNDHDGLPGIDLEIAQVPVSRFELMLPGDKAINVEPQAGVTRRVAGGRTTAIFNLARTDSLVVTWPEAVPADEGAHEQARANAAIYHLVQAEDGVLHVTATVAMEIAQGKMSQFELAIPRGVVVNDVRSDGGGLSDWRAIDGALTVYLDREVEDAYTFTIDYELLLGAAAGSTPFDVPLVQARGVHRQRGMVGLLATREVTLVPSTADNLSSVGENLFPAEVRNASSLQLTHTYRYVEVVPRLVATTGQRERVAGRFDADISTLISLGEVSTRILSTIEVHVKSGTLSELVVMIPADVNLLDVTAPSKREHRVETVADGKRVTITFTQDLEGHFAVELRGEKIAPPERRELDVPAPHVVGAEVERGRVAIEALAAVQVDLGRAENMTAIDAAELPPSLLVRTSNPVLLAYKYVQANPVPLLALQIARHREIETHDAAIDQATYRTLVTEDGLAVTTARFMMRNQRKQFLRVDLPPDAEVWSASVQDHPQAPAAADAQPGGLRGVLLNIVHSTEPFPVEVVYSTRLARLSFFGRVRAQLPRTDVEVTRTTWEVFVPSDWHYGEPSGDLRLVRRDAQAVPVDAQLAEGAPAGLALQVPTDGVGFVFEKLYAGTAEGRISIPYASSLGNAASHAIGLAGTMILWLLAFAFIRRRHLDTETGSIRRRALAALIALGLVGASLVAFSSGYLRTSPLLAILATLFVILGAAGQWIRIHRPQWFAHRRVPDSTPPAVAAAVSPPAAPSGA